MLSPNNQIITIIAIIIHIILFPLPRIPPFEHPQLLLQQSPIKITSYYTITIIPYKKEKSTIILEYKISSDEEIFKIEINEEDDKNE